MSIYRKPTGSRYGTHPEFLNIAAPTLTINTTTKVYVPVPARCYVSRAFLLVPGASAVTAGTASLTVRKYVDDGAGDKVLATVNPELATPKVSLPFTFDTTMTEGDRSIAAGGLIVIAATADNNAVTNGAGMLVALEVMALD